MDAPIAPTRADLVQVYGVHDPRLAGHQQAEAVVADADGITVLCSANPGGEGEHTWLLRLADDGSVRWERQYDPGLGTGRAIATPIGGGFVIAGEVRRSHLEYEAQLVRLDADGHVLASGSFGPRGATGFNAVTVVHDGSTLAGGTARWQGWLVRAAGARHVSWELLIGDVDEVVGLAALPEGGFALAAGQERSTTGLGGTRLAVFADDGRVRWWKGLPPSGRAEPAALAAHPDGGLVAVGHRLASEHEAAKLWVVRVDPAGEVAWERLLGSADENVRGRAVVLLADGGVVVAGDAPRAGGRGVRVVRLAADGTTAWECALGGLHEHSLAGGLAPTNDGGLVLVGSTTAQGPGKTNAWILRLDGDGRRLWERVFDLAV